MNQQIIIQNFHENSLILKYYFGLKELYIIEI